MSKSKNKIVTRYAESDLATLINDRMLEVQSPEGMMFKSLHVYESVVYVRIGNQKFIITVTSEDRLS